MNKCDYDYSSTPTKIRFEDKISQYKHTMEFIRTIIGFIVLGIQVFVLYRLYTK